MGGRKWTAQVIHLACDIKPIKVVACSGGPDSMAALSFLHQHKVKAAYFHHGTNHGEEAKNFVVRYCHAWKIDLIIGEIKGVKPSNSSPEQFWREERYKFLDSLGLVYTTAHNLNDLAETYIMGCIHGDVLKNMYVEKGLMRRAFLYTPKEELLKWVNDKLIPYVNDPSNFDKHYDRSIIRHDIIPHILKINPGFLKVVKNRSKKVEENRGKEVLSKH